MPQAAAPINWKSILERAAAGFYAATGIDSESAEAYVILMDVGCLILDRAENISAKTGREFKPHAYQGYRAMIGCTLDDSEYINADFPAETGISLNAIYQEVQQGRDPRKKLLASKVNKRAKRVVRAGAIKALKIRPKRIMAVDLMELIPLQMTAATQPVGI